MMKKIRKIAMKKGIIFDMDGTLWDSAEGVALSWNEVLREKQINHKVITTEDIKGVMGKTMDVIAEVLFAEMGEKERMALLDSCCRHENDYLREHGGILYDNLEIVLAELQKKYPLYIVSNCQSGYIEAFLAHYDFGKYFEDMECFGNNKKKKGDNIALVVERNQLDNAVYVGDIQGDYDSSMQAGVRFIHAAYGFGTINQPVAAIHSFDQLLEVVETIWIE